MGTEQHITPEPGESHPVEPGASLLVTALKRYKALIFSADGEDVDQKVLDRLMMATENIRPRLAVQQYRIFPAWSLRILAAAATIGLLVGALTLWPQFSNSTVCIIDAIPADSGRWAMRGGQTNSLQSADLIASVEAGALARWHRTRVWRATAPPLHTPPTVDTAWYPDELLAGARERFAILVVEYDADLGPQYALCLFDTESRQCKGISFIPVNSAAPAVRALIDSLISQTP